MKNISLELNSTNGVITLNPIKVTAVRETNRLYMEFNNEQEARLQEERIKKFGYITEHYKSNGISILNFADVDFSVNP